MITDATRMCAVLVGLPEHARILGVSPLLRWLEVHIRLAPHPVVCTCRRAMVRNGTRTVRLVDLPSFGQPVRLVWRKQRWLCQTCGRITTEQDPMIGSPRCTMTTRAAKTATIQVGMHGRSVAEVASDFGCDWHTVMDAVVLYGSVLVDDPNRIGTVTAVGLDETLFTRSGPFRERLWSTQIVDVRGGQLLDVVEGRDGHTAAEWFDQQPDEWLDEIVWAALDLSASYRKVYDTMLPDALQVADPFHVVQLANRMLDEVRRRVQNETLGHRGRKDDPLYRARRRLLLGRERLTGSQAERVAGLVRAGDPRSEVGYAYAAKEVVRQIYEHTNVELAEQWLDELIESFIDASMPVEVRRLGRTIRKWRDQILAWHASHVSNGPTEAVNNLAKRIKRVAFGLTNFTHHRIRCLLYAGKPNWALLDTITL